MPRLSKPKYSGHLLGPSGRPIPYSMIGARIMIVQADSSASIAVERTLTRLGHTVRAIASSGQQAIETAGEMRPDLLLVDLDEDANGIEVAARARSSYGIPVLYLVGSAEADLMRRARTTCPVGYVLKPVIEHQLTLSVETALDICKRERQHKESELNLTRALAKESARTRLMRMILDNISDGVAASDLNGALTYVNRACEKISGFGLIETLPEQWSKVYGAFYPDGKTLFPWNELPLVRAMRGEAVDDVEMLIRNPRRPQGVYITVSSRPLVDESGNRFGAVSVFRDLFDLKAKERQLTETVAGLEHQTATMEAIINSVSDGIIAADETGNVTLFNPAARRSVGMDMSRTNMNDWSDLYELYYPDRVTQIPIQELPLGRAIQGESVDNMEVFVRPPDSPEGVYFSVSGRPIRQASSPIRGGVVVFRDISERMRADQALLEAFSEGRLQILDTILHNIGNAINTVSIGIGTIQEELNENVPLRRFLHLVKAIEAHEDNLYTYLRDDPKGQIVIPFIIALGKDFLTQNRAMKETSERVDKTVSQIVDIIRTERSVKGISPVYKTVNLEKVVNDAVKLLQNSLRRRGIDPVVDCREAPEEIWIQESRLHQMLVNLVKNSIEAIDALELSAKSKGIPRIKIQAYTDDEFLVLDVTDNGIGIDEKHKRLIFSAGFTTKESGTGLGLHSIANLVIASGGEVQPLSAGIGKGTTMRVKLRRTSVTPKSIGASAPIKSGGARDEV